MVRLTALSWCTGLTALVGGGDDIRTGDGATNRRPCAPGGSVGLESKPQRRSIDPAFTISDGAVCEIAPEPPGSRTTNATESVRALMHAASRRRPGIHG